MGNKVMGEGRVVEGRGHAGTDGDGQGGLGMGMISIPVQASDVYRTALITSCSFHLYSGDTGRIGLREIEI